MSAGLSKMSVDISKALFRKLATRGVTFNTETFRSLKATYYRIALDFVETYHNDAVMNGLSLDIHTEEKAVELFAENIMKAGEAFLDRPMERPFIPSWTRVISAVPDVLERLCEAVEADHAEFDGGLIMMLQATEQPVLCPLSVSGITLMPFITPIRWTLD